MTPAEVAAELARTTRLVERERRCLRALKLENATLDREHEVALRWALAAVPIGRA